MKEKFPVVYDSTNGGGFIVKKDNYDLIFKESKAGLHYHDMGGMDINLHINTVAENKQWFTCRQYQQAVQARKLYAMVGSPSPANFKNM
eukprot:9167480-Ditylum_brightwellii.AAC.1